MHSQPQSWETTRLWGLVQDRAQPGDPVPQLLRNEMPEIETVVSKGGTAPIDFTLHDEEHAFRVAERMAELLPDDVAEKLGTFEICLLLLSAYLHDIGMTPTRKVVKHHHRYILTKGENLLSEAEARDLQSWLDEAHGGLELPVEGGLVTVGGLDKAEELLAYYCRHRHNDWSEAWIREHLTDAKPPLYPGWVEDLVNLSRSHHEGLEALRQTRFNARYRGSPTQSVNLRFLAALLRVADVMEFDPERTPDVIIGHREIAPKSRVYWHKDRFSFVVDRYRREFRLDATTPDAKVHRAVLETVQQVDLELLTCNSLATSGAFRIGSFEDERCYWPWPAKVNATVTEQEGRFVYIDGTFRPEPQHILKLLGGVKLYKDSMVAVRELLQNALDAVKEQIAWERLRHDNPSDLTWDRKLGELHKVTLSLVQEEDGIWLVCNDDGVGMTRAIIERHLLVGGAPTLPEVHRLQREASAHGFSLERSGQFGIGVLSYFMIADRMIISTRRSHLAGGDPEGGGWCFKTEGLGGFGELTPAFDHIAGTELRLRIRRDSIERLQTQLVDYVKGTIASTPCRLQLNLPGQSLALGPGWCRTPSDFDTILLTEFKNERLLHTDVALLPLKEVERRELEDRRWSEIRAAAAQQIGWIGPIEGELPNNLGRYRVHLTFFRNAVGPCFAFLDSDGTTLCRLPSGSLAIFPGLPTRHSWRGFDTSGHMVQSMRYYPARERPFIVEIDWRGGDVSIDRRTLQLGPSLRECSDASISKAKSDLGKLFYNEYMNEEYFSINSQIVSCGINPKRIPKRYYWMRDRMDRPGVASWAVADFPCAVFLDKPIGSEIPKDVRWNGRDIPILRPFSMHGGYSSLRPLLGENPDRLVMYGIEPVLLWEQAPRPLRGWSNNQWLSAAFPPEWDLVIGLSMEPYTVLNGNHCLVKDAQRDAEWPNLSPLFEELQDEVLRGNLYGLSRWIVTNGWKDEIFWNGIRDNCGAFYEIAFGHVRGICRQATLLTIERYSLRVLGVEGLTVAEYAMVTDGRVSVNNISLERPSRSKWCVMTVPEETRAARPEGPADS